MRSSTKSCLCIVFRIPNLHKNNLLIEQALLDGNYNIFLYAAQTQPLLSSLYTAAVIGNLPEAILFLQKEGITQSQRPVFEAVRLNREECFKLLKCKNEGKYARKCMAIPDRDWLPRIMRLKQRPSEELCKYAVKYAHFTLMSDLLVKHPEWFKWQLLWSEKTRNSFLFDVLTENCTTLPEPYIYLIDDFDFFEKLNPHWKSNYQEHNIACWKFGALEIAWNMLIQMFDIPTPTKSLNIVQVFAEMTDHTYLGPINDNVLLFLFDYHQPVDISYQPYLPIFELVYSFPGAHYDAYYAYDPVIFTKESNLQITLNCGQLGFALWCEQKGIKLELDSLFRSAVLLGSIPLLEYTLRKGYVVTWSDFIFSLKDRNKKGMKKTIVNNQYFSHKCVAQKTRCGNWSKDLIPLVYHALSRKELSSEEISLVLDNASLSVLDLLKEVFTQNITNYEEGEKGRILRWLQS